MKLSAAQLDRARGAALGAAIGDALGAPYEFGLASVGDDGPQMIGGGLGNFAPGEWTDDTAMAWCVLDVAATGADLRTGAALTEVARRFRDWYDSHPPDIGNQTRAVLGNAGPSPTGEGMSEVARELHERHGRAAGNGSLMRTFPVALRYLDDPTALAEAAGKVSALTHADPRAIESCVLWSLAIRHAIVNGELNLRDGLAMLDEDAARYWDERITEAETVAPSTFAPNGWAVAALQAAWSAITHTPVPDAPTRQACEHLGESLRTAIEIGHDTDTVAAIAGALLGARWGGSAIPAEWRRLSHGYPGLRGDELAKLAHLAANGGPGAYGWPLKSYIQYGAWSDPAIVEHPYDNGVLLGNAPQLDSLPDDVTAVVSMCLLGSRQVSSRLEHVTFPLIDVESPDDNPNLDFMIADIAGTIATLRDEGHRVFVHCVAAQSRTPTAAIAYAMLRGADRSEATRRVCSALPNAQPNGAFIAALLRFEHTIDGSRRD